MSRAFVNEDAQEGEVLIPPRAPLPSGVANYVTPRGLSLLKDEMRQLEADRAALQQTGRKTDTDRVRKLAVVRGRIQLLKARMDTAQVVRASDPDTVRFGAHVTVRTVRGPREGLERTFQIVGVDEADVSEARIAFVAPIARAVNGCATGSTTTLRTADGEETLEIIAVTYS